VLRRWRERALLTQEELAERSGLSVRTVRRLEGDSIRHPRGTTLRRLDQALGLDPAERAKLAAAACSTAPAIGHEGIGDPALAPQTDDPAWVRDRLARAHDALSQAEQACRKGREALRVLISTPT
jgi:transcriptional regulator with XRE-family HTH domain